MDIKQIESIFFKAMLEGWSFGAEANEVHDMPGHWQVEYRNGDFYVLDRYCVTPNSPKSADTTTIWDKDIPVWLMNYGGFYHKSAMSFLKSSLRVTYKKHEFVGGRGPLTYAEDALTYENRPRLNSFSEFEGREMIYIRDGVLLGYHEYWGMSLL